MERALYSEPIFVLTLAYTESERRFAVSHAQCGDHLVLFAIFWPTLEKLDSAVALAASARHEEANGDGDR